MDPDANKGPRGNGGNSYECPQTIRLIDAPIVRRVLDVQKPISGPWLNARSRQLFQSSSTAIAILSHGHPTIGGPKSTRLPSLATLIFCVRLATLILMLCDMEYFIEFPTSNKNQGT